MLSTICELQCRYYVCEELGLRLLAFQSGPPFGRPGNLICQVSGTGWVLFDEVEVIFNIMWSYKVIPSKKKESLKFCKSWSNWKWCYGCRHAVFGLLSSASYIQFEYKSWFSNGYFYSIFTLLRFFLANNSTI